MTSPLAEEKIWFNKHVYEEAERQYYESQAKLLMKNGIIPRPIYFQLPPVEQLALIQMPKESQKMENKSPILAGDNLPLSPPLTPKAEKPQSPKGKEIKEMKNEADKEGMKKKKKKDKSKKSKLIEEVVEKPNGTPPTPSPSSLAAEVAKARWHIKQSLEFMDGVAVATADASPDVLNLLASLQNENAELKKVIGDLKSLINNLDLRLMNLENRPSAPAAATPTASKATTTSASTPSPKAPAPAKKDDDDDDVDLFGSDSEEEDDAAKKVREQRLAEYAAKKSKKPVLIAKSNIILDVKPWDDETDMAAMEKAVRAIEMDGLVWGASKLVPLAYGIKKLQISCVVEDDKVSVDLLQETIQDNEDYVQSVDIAAFNKV